MIDIDRMNVMSTDVPSAFPVQMLPALQIFLALPSDSISRNLSMPLAYAICLPRRVLRSSGGPQDPSGQADSISKGDRVDHANTKNRIKGCIRFAPTYLHQQS